METTTTAGKLNYVAGKLGLIPAFGDSIGKDVNKAELSLCRTYAQQAAVAHAEALAIMQELAEQHDAMLATFGKQGFGWGRLVSDKARAVIVGAEFGDHRTSEEASRPRMTFWQG